jgi:uncharacterized membrane protein
MNAILHEYDIEITEATMIVSHNAVGSSAHRVRCTLPFGQYTRREFTMPGVTDSHADDKKVLTATFPTQGGANLAVKKLQDLEKQGLLDVDNTITVNKNAWDKIDVHETTGGSGRKDAGIGALVGGVLGVIFPPSILATTALGAALGGMIGVLRGSNFDESEIKAMADELQPGQSMLVAIVEPQWQDEVEAALNGVATKIGWAVMSAATANELAGQGKAS